MVQVGRGGGGLVQGCDSMYDEWVAGHSVSGFPWKLVFKIILPWKRNNNFHGN